MQPTDRQQYMAEIDQQIFALLSTIQAFFEARNIDNRLAMTILEQIYGFYETPTMTINKPLSEDGVAFWEKVEHCDHDC